MKEQTLNELQLLKHSPYYPGIEAALAEMLEEYKSELETCDGEYFGTAKGKIIAIRELQKTFSDLDLLREQWSKRENSNANPAIR